jgi:hypothetical protein
MDARPNIVLVHGAWADGSCWSGVIERLQADGYHVTAPQFPLTALADDVARLRQVLDLQDGPAVATALEAGESAPAGLELVPLSRFELLRLLRLLILPAPCRDADHVLRWSAWRRRYQHRARAYHQRWPTYADSPPREFEAAVSFSSD